jgi:16S rRNA (guanine(966)-N(2))-methyltransferase RsmD
MRVIAGSARGRKLASVPGDSTRPITDRAKEALFSILGPWIDGAQVLDLFGGTGAVGIEALSRGASSALFLDLAPAALRTMRDNLRSTGLASQATVLRQDAFRWLGKGPREGQSFDLIYVAPPQWNELWQRALAQLEAHPQWLAEGGRIVVQIDPLEDAPIESAHFEEVDRRRYGGVLLRFLERGPNGPHIEGDGT